MELPAPRGGVGPRAPGQEALRCLRARPSGPGGPLPGACRAGLRSLLCGSCPEVPAPPGPCLGLWEKHQEAVTWERRPPHQDPGRLGRQSPGPLLTIFSLTVPEAAGSGGLMGCLAQSWGPLPHHVGGSGT